MAKKRKEFETSMNENRFSQVLERAKTFYKNDSAKAVATVIAVLLIPSAVVAYNYATNRNPDILEGQSSNNQESSEQTVPQETVNPDATAPAVQAEKPKPADAGVGGIDQVKKLPFTDSVESYVVEKGDNVYKISQKVCGDNSFYINNMRRNYLKVGSEVFVSCE